MTNKCTYCRDKESMLGLIRSAGLTQGQFAELLEVSAETLRLWSLGRCQPRLQDSLKAMKILGCTIEQFAKACKIP